MVTEDLAAQPQTRVADQASSSQNALFRLRHAVRFSSEGTLDPNGDAPLVMAAYLGHAEIVRKLLESATIFDASASMRDLRWMRLQLCWLYHARWCMHGRDTGDFRPTNSDKL